MTAEIKSFTGNTLLKLEADDVLEAAKARLETVLLAGWTNEDEFYMASTTSNTGEIFLLLELARDALIRKMRDGESL